MKLRCVYCVSKISLKKKDFYLGWLISCPRCENVLGIEDYKAMKRDLKERKKNKRKS